MFIPWQLGASVFLGWALGANDASNVFGTAVASRMVRFRTAALLAVAFILLGAVLQGAEGMETYQNIAETGSLNVAFVVALAAAAAVASMTVLRLPVSTSQAVVGALVAVGWQTGRLDLAPLAKVVAAWVGTPLGAMLFSLGAFLVVGKLQNLADLNLFGYDRLLRILLIAAGSYGAYALGANNVANVTGAFVGPDMLSPFTASVLGGASIGLGVATYSRNVMMTVGKDLVKLDAFSAFIVVLSEAVTVHAFAYLGVPVSTSQAVVGAVLGMGIVKGVKTVNTRTLGRIVFGWVGTPAVSAALAVVLFQVFKALGLV